MTLEKARAPSSSTAAGARVAIGEGKIGETGGDSRDHSGDAVVPTSNASSLSESVPSSSDSSLSISVSAISSE
nr:hypothetical protein [Tanacetum cinerariifolium]